jgi:hypothetical protein
MRMGAFPIINYKVKRLKQESHEIMERKRYQPDVLE